MKSESWIQAILQADSQYPAVQKKFSYGTSGFRTIGEELERVAFRSGVYTTLLSRCFKNCYYGIMITASHNPARDNGLKIMNHRAEMLPMIYQSEKLQIEDIKNVITNLPAQATESEKQKHEFGEGAGHVCIAHDTRVSAAMLKTAVMNGIKVAGGICVEYGLLTTPQLHFLVEHNNIEQKELEESSYYEHFGQRFINFIGKYCKFYDWPQTIYLDTSDGVGGPQMKKFLPHISQFLNIEINNCGEWPPNEQSKEITLNADCGAQFVQKQQKIPKGFTLEKRVGQKCVSFDGDSDRIVYFTPSQYFDLILMDGDKIGVLIIKFIKATLGKVKLGQKDLIRFSPDSDAMYTCDFVQTAYANGASRIYLKKNMKVQSVIEPTGVKYLHHRAQQADLGLYFEANGHGTLMCKVLPELQKLYEDLEQPVKNRELLKCFLDFMAISNQVVGDAISAMLLVEACLSFLQLDIQSWSSLYNEVPSAISKVYVKDREIFKVTYEETELLEPAWLQDNIDDILKATGVWGRCFIRPSGTENVVRVYAESESKAIAQKIVKSVCQIVEQNFGVKGQ